MAPRRSRRRNSMSTHRRGETKLSFTRAGDCMRFIVPLLALLLLGHTAQADSGAVIVTTSGKVAERDQSLAMDAAQNRLRAAGWEFVSKPLTSKEVQAV